MGLWHEISLNWFLWGFTHGMIFFLSNFWKHFRLKKYNISKPDRNMFISITFTFLITTIPACFIIKNTTYESLVVLGHVLKTNFFNFDLILQNEVVFQKLIISIVFIIVIEYIELLRIKTVLSSTFFMQSQIRKFVFYTIVVVLFICLGNLKINDFYYFNF